MKPTVSIAIETSCRAGGLALGRGNELIEAVRFDASCRHATQLVGRLDELLARTGLKPTDVDELYVSAGPGSFTGLRVGITVARTMAQAIEGLRLVAVPTLRAVAENARPLSWQHLGVVMDARDRTVYAGLFARRGDEIVPEGEPALADPRDFLARSPRPLLLIGEGLAFVEMAGTGIARAEPAVDLPTPQGVWQVGRRLAAAGEFIDYRRLRPIYSRSPQAERLAKDGCR
ncbi:MAG TPA: tRNA (adenosine(37)-N6)-threonylcarbamoyltransferase complex dimerization subunit type 1 TsaB [Phycisphaerae bacterium]|nr:tRNA (adenosine(37)-N6)-threonylcarbamoyltransferase complex dimerization subunit type 1 TsaB [Phycisphaerae bacterium]